MESICIRIVVLVIAIMFVASVMSLLSVDGAPKFEVQPAIIATSRGPTKSEAIMRALMPNGVWGDASQLDRFDRGDAINALKDAQVTATDTRAIGISFLLAAIGHEYQLNKKMLLQEFSNCAIKTYPHDSHCIDFIASYLMELSRRGDVTLLEPLFNASTNADGCFSSCLGSFYADMLFEEPEQFIRALKSRSVEEVRGLCQHAGGYTEEGKSGDVLRKLKQILTKSERSQAYVARICLSSMVAGYRRAIKDTRSMNVN